MLKDCFGKEKLSGFKLSKPDLVWVLGDGDWYFRVKFPSVLWIMKEKCKCKEQKTDLFRNIKNEKHLGEMKRR